MLQNLGSSARVLSPQLSRVSFRVFSTQSPSFHVKNQSKLYFEQEQVTSNIKKLMTEVTKGYLWFLSGMFQTLEENHDRQKFEKQHRRQKLEPLHRRQNLRAPHRRQTLEAPHFCQNFDALYGRQKLEAPHWRQEHDIPKVGRTSCSVRLGLFFENFLFRKSSML